MPSALEPSEVAARIKAARLLRGISQDELAGKLVEAGLPWRLAGALERGEQSMRTAHRAALAHALGLPERWFIVTVDELCVDEGDAKAHRDILHRLDVIEGLLRRRG